MENDPSAGVHRGLVELSVMVYNRKNGTIMYGITENQFKNYFEKASRLPGVTGENLLSLLERRLDNVVFGQDGQILVLMQGKWFFTVIFS